MKIDERGKGSARLLLQELASCLVPTIGRPAQGDAAAQGDSTNSGRFS